MVREAERRLGKFEHKVDAEVLSLQTKALKPLMVRGEAKYFPEIVTVEQKVKSLVEAEGVSTLKVRDYLNFGREMYILTKKFSKVTLSAEAQLKVNKWSDRGLDGSLLVGVAKLFGVTPSAPPAPPIVGYLDDLLDVEIVTPLDKEVLTYDQPTALWKNKAPTGVGELSSYHFRKSGCFHSTPVTGSATSDILTAGWLYASAFYVPLQTLFDRIGVWCDGSSTGSIRLGVYADNGNVYPSPLALDAGTVSVTTTGQKNIVINLLLNGGLYWVVVLTQSTPSLREITSICTYAPIGRADLWAGQNSTYYKTGMPWAPLPDPFPAGAGVMSLEQLVYLRKA